MPQRVHLYLWKQVPFLRLIVPLIAGVIIQFVFPLPILALLTFSGFTVVLSFVFRALSFSSKYSFRWIPGVSINSALGIVGALLMFYQDVRNTSNWVGNYDEAKTVMVTIQEPLVEKAKTYKAEATVEAVKINGEWKDATGKILVYVSKDSLKKMSYGSVLLFNKPLQEIKNAGNPGEFDYRQYNRFKNIFHQVFLKSNEYVVTEPFNGSSFKSWLFSVRKWVIDKLQQNIRSERESGVAEALLIGYRDDLDKDLVQAYSNTGVVHIIAISGLHLGMIYMVLVWLLKPFKRTKWIRWFKPILILTVLWVFTLLAGAVPSILRSAVMFSFIVLGETLNRKSSIYNTLASSAFVMLCINPYYLFDIGFQLSYAAVVSIVAFSKTIYNWLYIKNKMLDSIWKLVSVTLSAQVLTTPIIFYAFHQFPLFFIITNIVIVPLSSVILFAELLLLIASFIPVAANFIGFVTGSMLSFMNGFIEIINRLPFAVYDGIQNSLAETFLLYILIISIAYWLLNKAKSSLFLALTALLILITIGGYNNIVKRRQQKMIVYNIPQHKAIDFICGKEYAFLGDDTLSRNSSLNNFHLKPSRTLHTVIATSNLPGFYITYPFVQFYNKRILVIDSTLKFESASRIPIDLIVVSHNPRLYISDLAATFDCKQIVFDGSNSTWKINQWKKDCDNLHLRNYSTSDKGAFVLNL